MAVEQSLSNTPTLNVGDEAPDFNLPASTGDKITLSQYRGQKNVVLAFFPYSLICHVGSAKRKVSTRAPSAASPV
jgi:peroxiredoxin